MYVSILWKWNYFYRLILLKIKINSCQRGYISCVLMIITTLKKTHESHESSIWVFKHRYIHLHTLTHTHTHTHTRTIHINIQHVYGSPKAVLECILSYVWLFVSPWTVACQAPLSMAFPRQENCSGLPFPPPGDLPHPGIEPISPAYLALEDRFLITEPPRKPFT